ncbi:YgjP family zinc-dependent metalloprotease [Lysobacter sp. D1-1-M9]|uniref:YgjP family zinc-dependent metalloprotease n=1 Tax=Novilysobacter longmucuonensis TaxID=3098603 RepID=UPI002FC7AAFC
MPNPFRLLAPRTIQSDSFPLALADGRVVEVRRVRDPRSRRIKLSVDERGARLSLPLRASAVAGERFVEQHRDWLAQQIASYAAEALPRLVRGQTDSLPLRGAMLPLAWQAGRYTRLQHVGEDDAAGLAFTVPPRAGAPAIRRALRDFYEAQARTDLGRWLPRYLPGLPRPPRRTRFKVMSSQWGSLAPDGSMALDLSLVLARRSAFEYVLVHELCHLIHADHSRAFWREVEVRFPAWREERDYFRAEGRRLKATLRMLLS